MNVTAIIFALLRKVPVVKELPFLRSYGHLKSAIAFVEKMVEKLEAVKNLAAAEVAEAMAAVEVAERDREAVIKSIDARVEQAKVKAASASAAADNAERVAARLTNLAA